MEELTYSQYHLLIIPTVLIPLTMVSMGVSVIATFIAGLFGIKLKAEGPKRLMELLLKPKVLISALLLNVVILGGIQAYKYVNNLPAFIFNIKRKNAKITKPSDIQNYKDVPERKNIFSESNVTTKKLDISLHNQTKLSSGVFRAGALTGNSIFMGTTKGYVYEIERKTLKTLRKFYTGTFVTPAPLIWNKKLVFGEGVHHTTNARIYFFDLKSGELEKYFTSKGHTEGQGTFASYKGQERLFIVAGSDGVYSLDPKTLAVKWHNIDGHNDASVIVRENRVFVGTGREKGDSKKYRSYALAYDFLTGKTLWKRELAISSWMKPTLTKTDVCYVYGEIYFKSNVGGIQCFNQKTGLPTQSYATLSPVASIPLSLNNDIVFADNSGQICRIDMKNRSMKWCQKTHDSKKITYSPISYDPYRNLLVYSSQMNGVYFIHPKTGKIIYHWLPEKGVALKKEDKSNTKMWHKSYASALVTPEGWYIVDIRGNLRLLKPAEFLAYKSQ